MLDYLPLLLSGAIGIVGFFMKGGIGSGLSKAMLALLLTAFGTSLYLKYEDNRQKEALTILARSTGVDPAHPFAIANLILAVPEMDGELDDPYAYPGVGKSLLFGDANSGQKLGRLKLYFSWDDQYEFEFYSSDDGVFQVTERRLDTARRWQVLWGGCSVAVVNGQYSTDDCESQTSESSSWWSDLVAGGTSHGVALDASMPAAYWLSALEQVDQFGEFEAYAASAEYVNYLTNVLELELKFYPLSGEGAFAGCHPILKQRLKFVVDQQSQDGVKLTIARDGSRVFIPCEDTRGVG